MNKGIFAVSLAVSLGVLLAFGAASANAADSETIKIYAAAVVQVSLGSIAEEFEAETGNIVEIVFDSAGATEQHFRTDPMGSIVITTPERIGSIAADGLIAGGTTIALGSTVAGIAVPPGSPKPDISTSEGLRTTLLAAERIAFSDPARGATVGNHFMMVIEALGIREEVLAKAMLAMNGIETMHFVLDEGADIGITQTSEILQANPDALAGPFPPEFELATAYALWYPDDISPAARAFLDIVLSEEGRAELAAEGLVPPHH
jgi:molybdate transport system substrate-binding protein